MKIGRPANDALVEERVTVIYGLIIRGFSTRDILRFVADKKKNAQTEGVPTIWDIEPRQVEIYIARAQEEFKAQAAIHRETEFGKAIARLEHLYSSNIDIQDYKTALATEKTRIDMLGLNAPTKFIGTMVTLTAEQAKGMNDDELRAIVESGS